jgi:hypothetical protein
MLADLNGELAWPRLPTGRHIKGRRSKDPRRTAVVQRFQARPRKTAPTAAVSEGPIPKPVRNQPRSASPRGDRARRTRRGRRRWRSARGGRFGSHEAKRCRLQERRRDPSRTRRFNGSAFEGSRGSVSGPVAPAAHYCPARLTAGGERCNLAVPRPRQKASRRKEAVPRGTTPRRRIGKV